jgi:hypothetical protein
VVIGLVTPLHKPDQTLVHSSGVCYGKAYLFSDLSVLTELPAKSPANSTGRCNPVCGKFGYLGRLKLVKTPFFAHVTAIPANPSTVPPGFYMIWKQRGVLLRIQGRQIRREFCPNIIGHAGVQKRDLMF